MIKTGRGDNSREAYTEGVHHNINIYIYIHSGDVKFVSPFKI